MSLLEKAYQTYENQSFRVGVETAGEETLTPVSHMIANAHIEITLDSDGTFADAVRVLKEASKTIIPVTIESESRSGTSAKDRPHPLSDQLMYLADGLTGNHENYCAQLSLWANSEFSTPKLKAILNYIAGGTILKDLAGKKIISLDNDGKPAKGNIEQTEYSKCLVRWIVLDTGEISEAWRDKSLINSYIEWYSNKISKERSSGLCNITWDKDVLTDSHPKGVLSYANGAKLISSNDTSGFTYHGRFKEPDEAAAISYVATQKAHSALRWLAENYGVQIGDRKFVWWQLAKSNKLKPAFKIGEFSSGKITKEKNKKLSSFKNELKETLDGYKNSFTPGDKVIIVAFDAATTGRLSVTYYSEIGADDFADRIYTWYNTMSYSNDGHAPSIYNIIRYAYGHEQNERMVVDNDKFFGESVQRLLRCVVDKAPLPKDVVMALAHKFSRPLTIGNTKNLIGIRNAAFAAVKKYRYEKYGEEWTLALDKECRDRSYLFGRLLAVAEKIEDATYNDENRRVTNAERYQSIFVCRPFYTWKTLKGKLRPYKDKLKRDHYGWFVEYNKLLIEISDKIEWDDPNLNKGLSELYILGYYQQLSDFYKKHEDDSTALESDESDINEED
ncbi:MAG: type I-C CRISPR-associated protein Cas8c/Csd1 [Clostridiales bacterium]|nr:type I-C CRISPR-associated protein Cas8c/Csd1 [Clostridiales bacterium]